MSKSDKYFLGNILFVDFFAKFYKKIYMDDGLFRNNSYFCTRYPYLQSL